MTQHTSRKPLHVAAKKAGWMAAGGCLLALAVSTPAHGQLGLGTAALLAALETLNTTMQTVMQVPMQFMQQINQQMSDFTQNSVYPLAGIQSAQSLAATFATASMQQQQLLNTSYFSSQLPINQQLESAILSRDPNAIGNISSLFTQSYGTLPTTTTAATSTITAVDMGDATAQDSLKKAVELDALADKELQVSQQFLTQLQGTAPGNAPVISAQAAAWILQGHGYTQSGLAQLLRDQAAELGYTGANIKATAQTVQNVGGAVTTLPIAPQGAPK